jgi:hypothetical protein
LKYAWIKVAKEAKRYWKTDLPEEKLIVSEDARLMVIAYVLV